MKLNLIALAAAGTLFCGAQAATFAQINVQIGGAPPPVVVETPPAYVEQGATVNGVLVAPPPPDADYVLIDGSYYYWLPSQNVWVHAHEPHDWHPPEKAHIYHRWADHPMYKAHH